jgi:hypothetical protein
MGISALNNEAVEKIKIDKKTHKCVICLSAKMCHHKVYNYNHRLLIICIYLEHLVLPETQRIFIEKNYNKFNLNKNISITQSIIIVLVYALTLY